MKSQVCRAALVMKTAMTKQTCVAAFQQQQSGTSTSAPKPRRILESVKLSFNERCS